MIRVIARLRLGLIAALVVMGFSASAVANDPAVQTTWQLLDYIAVDYPGAVADGTVTNDVEYNEMQEFSVALAGRLADLPDRPGRAQLIADAAMLQRDIANKASASVVAKKAHAIARSLLAAYPVPLAPRTLPDLSRAEFLYASNCASCHGLNGDGNGPQAAGLSPPPIAFQDRDRARQRSIFGIYQVLENGVEGTAMQSFADLPAPDRWALAFYAGTFAFADVEQGKKLWETSEELRRRFPDMAALTSTTPADLAAEIGPEKAYALTAFLRSNPGTVVQVNSDSLSLARSKLQSSLAAYQAGSSEQARELALSAYLDGFEPLEALLATRDNDLLVEIEQAMSAFRSSIEAGQSVRIVEGHADRVETLFDEAEIVLAPTEASNTSTFVGAFVILLREGLEALLIVIAMVAFLRKAERQDALPYVHGGWVGALVAGALTWAAATYIIDISGAGRELTEGFGSLFAAVVLVSVGIWMHGKSQAGEWQRYINRAMSGALSRGSAWFLFGLAFLVVYREVFETILFYAALWNHANGGLILAGAGAAIAMLAVIAWAMLRYSQKLPIAEFFRYSSILIAVLAVVLAGKGVAALQEAGLISITLLSQAPRVAILGIFPALEPIGAQLLVTAMLVGAFVLNARSKTKV